MLAHVGAAVSRRPPRLRRLQRVERHRRDRRRRVDRRAPHTGRRGRLQPGRHRNGRLLIATNRRGQSVSVIETASGRSWRACRRSVASCTGRQSRRRSIRVHYRGRRRIRAGDRGGDRSDCFEDRGDVRPAAASRRVDVLPDAGQSSARRSDGSGDHSLLFAQEPEHLSCHEIRVHDGQVVSTTGNDLRLHLRRNPVQSPDGRRG